MKYCRSKAKTLIAEAKFFPPACLKTDLDYVKDDIEMDLEELLKGERNGCITVEQDWEEREKFFRSKDDVAGQINAQTVDSEIIDKLAVDENNCPSYLLNRKDCHDHNFGDYCSKKTKCYFQLYPTAMTCEVAKKFFVQHYHAALHVLTWVKYDHLADEAKFVLPPPRPRSR